MTLGAIAVRCVMSRTCSALRCNSRSQVKGVLTAVIEHLPQCPPEWRETPSTLAPRPPALTHQTLLPLLELG